MKRLGSHTEGKNRKKTKPKGLILWVCAVMHGLNHAFQFVLPPLYLSVRDDLGLDGLSPVMLLGTAYFLTYGAMSIPYGILGDRFSKKGILVIGGFLNSMAFLLAAGTNSYPVFVISMILAGLGGGAYHPVSTALITNLFGGMVGRALGLIGMGAGIGLFAGPLVSGFIGDAFGWRTSCIAFALMGLMITVAFMRIMPDEERVGAQEKLSAAQIGATALTLLPLLVVFVMRDFCFWGTTFLTPAMSQMNLGFSERAAGTLLGLMSLVGVVSQPLAGTLSDRMGRRRLLCAAMLIGGVFVIAFPYANATYIFVVVLLGGFALMSTVPVLDAVASEIVPPPIRGRVFGVTNTLGFVFGGLSPYIMGKTHDMTGQYDVGYLILGASVITGAVLVFTIPSKKARRY
jgi:FSR family fosmidomycin resistance protein-like MFS transporter